MKCILSILCFFVLLLVPFNVKAATVLPTDVTTPSEGNVMLGIEGEYITDTDAAIKRINEIRLEACKEGVISPSTGKKLTTSDYVPIKWSSTLEWLARIRAAEASMTMDHVRTNGNSCFEYHHEDKDKMWYWGENIAWNWSKSVLSGIEQWYDEKSDWVNKTGGVTGHYTSLINPSYNYIGLGTFYTKNAKYPNTTTGEFCAGSDLDESKGSSVSSCIQKLEVNEDNIKEYTLSGAKSITVGDTLNLSLKATVVYNDYWGDDLTTEGLRVYNASWSSSNTNVLTVDNSGKVTAKGCGSATITAKIGSKTKSVKITVNHTYDKGKVTKKATLSQDGAITYTCIHCGDTKTDTIHKVSDIQLNKTSFTYSGNAQKPTVTIKDSAGKTVPTSHYSIAYGSSINAGTYQATITFKGNYEGTVKKSYTINKATQSLTISNNKLVAVGKTNKITVSGHKTGLTYKSSNTGVATINNGVITAKTVGTTTITVSAAENTNYKKAIKSITVKVVPATTLSVTGTNTNTGVKLSWKKVAGATGYYVYRGNSKIATVKTLTYTDTKNSNGSTSTYKIVSYASTGTSNTGTSTKITRLTTPKISKLVNNKSKTMTVTYNKNAKASGYVIEYATNKNFTSKKTVKMTSVSKAINKLTKKKTYYVRVRSYKTVSGKTYYSAYSTVKKVKISK